MSQLIVTIVVAKQKVVREVVFTHFYHLQLTLGRE